MASLRKKYRLEESHTDKPVATAPTEELAKPPEPVADAPQPAEVIAETESNPVEDAAKSELLKRVREAERAAEFAQQRQAQQQSPQQQFAEPEPETPQMQDPREQFEAAIQQLPPRVQGWYRSHPQLLTDPEQASLIQHVYHRAAREVGEADTDAHHDRMEILLGLRHAEPLPEPRPLPERTVARPRYQGAPVSAPPTREAPSLSTGRAANERTPLTREELEIARASKISPEEYQKQKQKMLRLKAAGVIQDGG